MLVNPFSWATGRRFCCLFAGVLGLLFAPLLGVGSPRFEYADGGSILFEDGTISLRFDSRMYCRATLTLPDGTISMSSGAGEDQAPLPPQFIKTDGVVVKDFAIDYADFHSLSDIETTHGKGKQLKIWGRAQGAWGDLRKTVVVQMYNRYPGTALFQAEYENLGSVPVTVNTIYDVMWRLNPVGLWALHPRNWKWGEDFLFPVDRGTSLTGENLLVRINSQGEPASMGGGLPAVSYLTPKAAMTIGYLSAKMKVIRWPLKDETGRFTVGLERDLGLGPEKSILKPKEVYRSLETFVALHEGDFYEGIRVMSRLFQDDGVRYKNPPIESLMATTWSNRGSRDDWSKQYIIDMLPELKRYGVQWIHLGGRWETNLGDYEPSHYFDGEDDLKEFVAMLNRQGFRVTAFMSDLVVLPRSRPGQERPDLFVKDKTGKIVESHGLSHTYYLLCPAYAPAREYMRKVSTKLARDYGFAGVKDDGYNLPQPCYDPEHNHPYPEKSVEDYHLMIKTVYETFKKYHPNSFVVAFCFDGVMPLYQQLFHASRLWPNADQNSEWQARLKQKLFKAILGPGRVLLDDHSDAKHLSGRRGKWFLGPPSGLAMGSVLETVINPTYDYQGHDYDEIFTAYHREMLPEGGSYRNLYNMIFDTPEAHVVAKEDSLYYGFFAESFEGALELRGLESGARYRVTDYVFGNSYPSVDATSSTAILRDIAFENYLLLRLDKE